MRRLECLREFGGRAKGSLESLRKDCKLIRTYATELDSPDGPLKGRHQNAGGALSAPFALASSNGRFKSPEPNSPAPASQRVEVGACLLRHL